MKKKTPQKIAKDFFTAWEQGELDSHPEFKKYAEKLGDQLDLFCLTWTELDPRGNKQRWENRKRYPTWELGGRIGRWMLNHRTNFGKKSSINKVNPFDRIRRL